MAVWMSFAVLVAALLSIVGLLAERGLALLGRPVRWLWLAVMVASAGLPFVPEGEIGAPAASGGVAVSADPAASFDGAGGPAAGWMELMTAVPDSALLATWCLASATVLIVLLLSAETLRQAGRRWRVGTVAGERVHLSDRIGPAVFGITNARIVLPEWMLAMDESIQRLIVRHEREHLRTGDHYLLPAALSLIVLLPWCLPLWWQFHRLRSAVETDCDSRILRSDASARAYAHALVAVAGRRRRSVFPLPTVSRSGALLERRIRRIVAPPSGRAWVAPACIGAATVVAVGAAFIPAPSPPALTPDPSPPHASGPAVPENDTRRPGALPGSPGVERVAAEIRRHHSAAIAAGLPEESVIWFIEERTGSVARTGIERGTERKVEARVRARYPSATSDRSLAWSDVPAGDEKTTVIWILPPAP